MLGGGTFACREPLWHAMRYLPSLALALLAVGAGIGLPVQAAVNVRLREALGTPLRASLGSFAVGAVVLFVAVLIARGPVPGAATLARAPWWVWTGGAIGAFYVVASIVVVPRLGSAYAFALVVAGQMAMSLVIDRFGLFGVPQTPFSLARAAGVALLVGGVLLVRR